VAQAINPQKTLSLQKKSEFQGIMPASIPNTPSSPYQVRNQGACTSAIYLVQNQEGCKERNRTVCLVSAKGGYQGWNLQRSKRRISLCSMNPVENRKTPRRSPEPGDSIAPSSSTQLTSGGDNSHRSQEQAGRIENRASTSPPHKLLVGGTRR